MKALSRHSVFSAALIGTLLLPSICLPRDQATDSSIVTGSEGKTCDNSVLTIMVTANGKPVSQAEVIVMYSPTGEAPDGCAEGKMPPTNDAGEIAFASGGKGKVRIVVIAADWDTCHDYVNLKKGRQSHEIKLKRTQEPDHA